MENVFKVKQEVVLKMEINWLTGQMNQTLDQTLEQNRLNIIWRLNWDMWAEYHEQARTTHETVRCSTWSTRLLVKPDL